MKKQNLILLSVLVLSTLLFTLGCSTMKSNNTSSNRQEPYTLNIVNRSEASISEIRHEENSSGGGGVNADGSLISRNEVFQFGFDHELKTTTISIVDENKDILLTKTIDLDFNSKKETTFEIISNGNTLDLVSIMNP